jgi:glycosidase
MILKVWMKAVLIAWLVFFVSITGAYAQIPINRPPEDEIFYFLIPDRFMDGNPSNNFGGDTRQGLSQEDVLRHGHLPSDKGYYHGGDLAGVIMQLPYLKNLGVTAIWLAPVFKNKPVQPDPQSLYGHSAAYHGYWILDFLQVDPHLGTNEDLRSLIKEAHRRGMKVYLDIITNHTADVIRLEPWQDTSHGDAPHYIPKRIAPYRDRKGNVFDDAIFAYDGGVEERFPQMTDRGFPYRPVIPQEESTAKNPAWLNDHTNYHNRGNAIFDYQRSADTQGRYESHLYGDFFGLDDLFTEKPEVVKGMIDIYGHWIKEYRVDGFRIDTARHVNVEFWRVFGGKMKEIAGEAGIGHFFAFGEVFDERPEFRSFFTVTAKLQGVLDFGFQKTASDFASERCPTVKLRNFFEQDDYYTDMGSNVYAMPTFLGNHDMGRIGYFLRKAKSEASNEELTARSILAHALMFLARGTPVIYYGDEQGFTGDGGDKDAREDMFQSRVESYNDNIRIGTKRTTADSNFDQNHPIYKAIRTLSKLRSDHRSFRRGAQIHRCSSGSPAVYAFSRIDPEERVEYIVALNNEGILKGQGMPVPIPSFYKNGSFDLMYNSSSTAPRQVKSDEKGNLLLSIAPLDCVVYRAEKPIEPGAWKPNLSIRTPVDSSEWTMRKRMDSGYVVADRIEIRADLDADVFAKVTFSVKADNEETYRSIGIDMSPPYRIFFDAAGYSNGTTLSFKAAYDDLFGNTGEATAKDIKLRIEGND